MSDTVFVTGFVLPVPNALYLLPLRWCLSAPSIYKKYLDTLLVYVCLFQKQRLFCICFSTIIFSLFSFFFFCLDVKECVCVCVRWLLCSKGSVYVCVVCVVYCVVAKGVFVVWYSYIKKKNVYFFGVIFAQLISLHFNHSFVISFYSSKRINVTYIKKSINFNFIICTGGYFNKF